MTVLAYKIVQGFKVHHSLKCVLLDMAWFAKDDGTDIVVKVEEMAERVGHNVRELQRLLLKGKDDGWIRLYESPEAYRHFHAGGSGHHRRYAVILTQPDSRLTKQYLRDQARRGRFDTVSGSPKGDGFDTVSGSPKGDGFDTVSGSPKGDGFDRRRVPNLSNNGVNSGIRTVSDTARNGVKFGTAHIVDRVRSGIDSGINVIDSGSASQSARPVHGHDLSQKGLTDWLLSLGVNSAAYLVGHVHHCRFDWQKGHASGQDDHHIVDMIESLPYRKDGSAAILAESISKHWEVHAELVAARKAQAEADEKSAAAQKAREDAETDRLQRDRAAAADQARYQALLESLTPADWDRVAEDAVCEVSETPGGLGELSRGAGEICSRPQREG